MKNDEWLTPPHVLQALGPFDLDPCAPVMSAQRVIDAFYAKHGPCCAGGGSVECSA